MTTPVELPGFEKKWRQTPPVLLVPFLVSPTEGVSFVVSPHVVVRSGWCADRMDGPSYRQARRRRFCPAEFLDGHRQGPENRMGAAAAGALSGSPGGCERTDSCYRAAV